MKTNKLFSSFGLLTILGLLLVVNLLAGQTLKSFRLDLTNNQLYTLSTGTKNILAKLDEPITLRLFFSEKFFTGLPSVMTYGQRVRDLLEEYVSLSGGKLKLIISDPEPFSETEDQAVQFGLQGVPVDASGNQAYFGLAGTNAMDDEEVIAFFQPDKEESLEYDVTKLVYKLAHPKQRTVGLISTLPMEGLSQANPFAAPSSNSQAWFMLSQIKQSFEVKDLESSVEHIPEDIDVLMLVHPKGLSEKTLFAIDQFVLHGGRLLAFLDPFSEADQPVTDPQNPMAAMQAPRNSTLEPLLKAWGVELVSGKIAGDRITAQRVQTQAGRRVQAMDYVAWLSLSSKNFNDSDFITRDLTKINMATPGYLKKLDGAETDISPLIETSVEAMAIDSMQFRFGANPANLLRQYKPGGEKLVLAARITGKIKSAYPDGVKDADAISNVLTASDDAINVIVVADTDMLENKHWVRLQNFFGNQIAQPIANNDVFVLNAIENLSGSNDLISLRSRSKSARPFLKVEELKREAEKRFQDQEKALQNKLQQAERKLAELQRKQDGNGSMILSTAQKQEILKFRQEQLETRKALRNVKHELVKSIESLGVTLKVINIGLMPLLVIVFAILMAMRRTRRLKKSMA
ncbi:MAG TPA: hypothetical protein ENK06_10350 [Gammaproteobacteria bacterium]|nr:hypothetical protein [Gammaproteobacteria bacterium]